MGGEAIRGLPWVLRNYEGITSPVEAFELQPCNQVNDMGQHLKVMSPKAFDQLLKHGRRAFAQDRVGHRSHKWNRAVSEAVPFNFLYALITDTSSLARSSERRRLRWPNSVQRWS